MSLEQKRKIIVVTGVESSGKTSLALGLANVMEQAYIPEYARTYLEQRKGVYQYEDLEEIARLQLMAIENATSEFVIVDTALIVLKIWSEEKYGKCSRFILNELASFRPTTYFLCGINIPWEEDSLREHPTDEDRKRLHQNYIAHLQEQDIPFTIISGSKKERLEKAAEFIKYL